MVNYSVSSKKQILFLVTGCLESLKYSDVRQALEDKYCVICHMYEI